MAGRTLIPGKPIPASEVLDYSIDRTNSSEVFSERFVNRLKVLNECVRASGEVIEGGIFYWDQDPNFSANMPAADLAPARRNLWRSTRFKSCLLEIGVNACHSALLSLSANERLVYHGVDIGHHKYTEPCVRFLMQEFPGRVHIHFGDSREVLPYLATHQRRPGFRHLSCRWRPYERTLPSRYFQLPAPCKQRIWEAFVVGRYQCKLDFRRLLRICLSRLPSNGDVLQRLGGRRSQCPGSNI